MVKGKGMMNSLTWLMKGCFIDHIQWRAVVQEVENFIML
jgi:hypothetical protein